MIEQIKSVYGNAVTDVRIESKTHLPESLDSQIRNNQPKTVDLMNSLANEWLSDRLNTHLSVWEKVRVKLVSYYGEAVDRSWFSKLTAVEDSEAKLLNIKAPSHFLRDWVENNYQTMIRVLCEQQGYRLGQFV